MIDLRYHIVSLVAVFLALAVGVLVGTTVLDAAAVNVLERQVRTLRATLDDTRGEVTQIRAERDQLTTFVDQLSARTTAQRRLAGRRFLVIDDGQSQNWGAPIVEALVGAGAQNVGTIRLERKLELADENAAGEFSRLIRSALGDVDPGQDQGDTGLRLLGERLFEPTGQSLLRRLADAEFVTLVDAQSGAWPPAGSFVVALGSVYPKTATATGLLAALAVGAGRSAPTVVTSPSAEPISAVTAIRAADPPSGVSTFDAGGATFGKLGAVLTAVAALDGRYGHFGTERGHRLLPEA